MKKVYIAHPLRGDEYNNVQKATEICKALADEGQVAPFSPLHAFSFYPTSGDQTKVMQYCFKLLASCDELWVYGNYGTSEGCQAEIAFAKCRGIPIRIQAKGGAGWIDLPNPKKRTA